MLSEPRSRVHKYKVHLEEAKGAEDKMRSWRNAFSSFFARQHTRARPPWNGLSPNPWKIKKYDNSLNKEVEHLFLNLTV